MRHKHSILDFYDCAPEIFQSARFGLEVIEATCKKAQLNIVGKFSKNYPNGGYSCGVFLSESHISLHTWPEWSYCAIDIFLCRGNLSIAEKNLTELIKPKYKQKILLFRGNKKLARGHNWVYANRTKDYYEAFRAIDKIKRKKSSYQVIESINNESLGKVLFLDGDIQLATNDEKIYHEYLVHPAILAHNNPQKVLLLGGGDGGALREIVRHNQVKEISMIEIDAEVVNHCSINLPEVNQGAFKDKRVKIIYQDAARFLGTEKFDVIISDLTAPQGPSLSAYKSLLTKLSKSMNKGCFVSMHSGWWSNQDADKISSNIIDQFPHILLRNQWVESFACFWSFLLCWCHNEDIEIVLKRMSERAKNLNGVSHFSALAYRKEIFTRV